MRSREGRFPPCRRSVAWRGRPGAAAARGFPAAKAMPRFEPLFMTQRNIEMSLDSFPVEWLEIRERHLLLEGEDLVATLEVQQAYVRMQCEHELRGKFIQL